MIKKIKILLIPVFVLFMLMVSPSVFGYTQRLVLQGFDIYDISSNEIYPVWTDTDEDGWYYLDVDGSGDIDNGFFSVYEKFVFNGDSNDYTMLQFFHPMTETVYWSMIFENINDELSIVYSSYNATYDYYEVDISYSFRGDTIFDTLYMAPNSYLRIYNNKYVQDTYSEGYIDGMNDMYNNGSSIYGYNPAYSYDGYVYWQVGYNDGVYKSWKDGIDVADIGVTGTTTYTGSTSYDYLDGYGDGETVGQSNGYDDGVNAVVEDGIVIASSGSYVLDNLFDYNSIYNSGRIEGVNEAGALTMQIQDFVPGVLGAIFAFFFTIAQISVLGISLLDILVLVLTVGALILVVRIIMR